MGKLEVRDLEGVAGRGHWRVELDGELLCTFPYSDIESHQVAKSGADCFKSGVEVGIGLVGQQF